MAKRLNVRVFIISTVFIFYIFVINIYAESLEDIFNIEEGGTSITTSGVINNGNSGNSNNNVIDIIKDGTDISGADDGVKEIISVGNKIFASVVQVLVWALLGLIIIRLLLDLFYMRLPFTRSILGGSSANSNTDTSTSSDNRYNNNRYNSNSNYSNNNNNNNGEKRCWVSNGAIEAGNSGEIMDWLKNTVIVEMIAVPILVTLLVTGTVYNMSLDIGVRISETVKGINI